MALDKYLQLMNILSNEKHYCAPCTLLADYIIRLVLCYVNHVTALGSFAYFHVLKMSTQLQDLFMHIYLTKNYYKSALVLYVNR